jgi:DNA-binding LytR/AlgR family response regulator
MSKLPISVVVADDEQPARDELKFIIGKCTDFKVVGEADCGRDAINLVDRLKPEVLFLDIKMGDMDGFEVARENMHSGNEPITVFATAYNQYAIDAFAVRAVDYVLKPYESERITETLSRLRKILSHRNNASLMETISEFMLSVGRESAKEIKNSFVRIPVEHNGRTLLLDPQEIVYAGTNNDKSITIHCKNDIFTAKCCLNNLEEKLGNATYRFFRVHRSFLINLNEIREIIPWFKGNYQLVMKDNKKSEIPVSRLYSKQLKDMLGF